MRICLVTHGFPPLESTGVENYTAALAAELAAAGHTVEVFAPRNAPDLPDLSLRREVRHGYGLTWLTTNTPPADQREMLDPPGVADRFGDFLDRERPELVHFQHVIKLGLSLIEKASGRGIPTLYTAHDYYPVCHRFTLLRPDLERCEVVGDSELCSRCDLALSYLNKQPDLGDYQMGVLPSQLSEQEYGALRSLLDGDPSPSGFTVVDQSGFAETRAELDARRAKAFDGLQLILSPTRYLAERLTAGGIDPRKVQILTYGAETAGLESLEPPQRRDDRPVHFGYLGGLSKHKGVHLLLEAFSSLSSEARLSVWGDSSDQKYIEGLRELIIRTGASWRGPFRRAQLASCLAEVDVVVVPSIWVENYPFVIREAFAAGRPVITSDVGALPESVRDGVDGLLFEPNDSAALARAMGRLIEEDGLLARLVGGIAEVKNIRTQVAELVPVYKSLIEAGAREPEESLPESIRPAGLRYDELAALPGRDLFRRVLGGLGKVGSLFGETDLPIDDLPVEALASGSNTQILLRDLKRETDWLRAAISSHQQTEGVLRERIRWREEELASKANEVEWMRKASEDANKGFASLKEENDWMRDLLAKRDKDVKIAVEESTWLRGLLGASKQEAEWLRDTLVAYERNLSWQQEKIHALQETGTRVEEKAQRIEEKAQRIEEEAQRIEEEAQLIEEQVLRVEEEKAVLESTSEEQQARLDALGEVIRTLLEPHRRFSGRALEHILDRYLAESDAKALEYIANHVPEGNRRIRELLEELETRRMEMREAGLQAQRRLVQLILSRTGLGRRVSSWSQLNGDDAGGNATRDPAS